MGNEAVNTCLVCVGPRNAVVCGVCGQHGGRIRGERGGGGEGGGGRGGGGGGKGVGGGGE